MAGITDPRPGEGRFDTLIRLLGVKDPQTRQEAAAMFCRVGKLAVRGLVHEALKRGRRSQHRIAILDVVQKIGGPLGNEDMFRLQSLLGHHDSGVRAKAELVIMSLCRGIPDTLEALALERDCNPFLQPLPRGRPRRNRSTGSAKAALRSGLAAIVRYARSKAAQQKRDRREQGRRA